MHKILIKLKKKKSKIYKKKEEIGEVVKSEVNLMAMDEKPTSIFPLKEIQEEELSLNIPPQLRKMQSAEIPSSKNTLDELFSQIAFSTDQTKEPCKVELVKNLYTRTFSGDNSKISEEMLKKNENKINEDNFYRGYLMNPYNVCNSPMNQEGNKWNFNKQHSSSTLNTNFTDDAMKRTPNNNNNFNYPNLNDVDYGKFTADPPKRKCESDNDLLQFTPVERYQAKQNEGKKELFP